MKIEKKRRIRYFFLSFSTSFLLISLLLYGMVSTVHPASVPSVEYEPLEDATDYLPSREQALNVLFVGVAPDGAEAGMFILARFDPERGRVPIVVFPRQTAVRNRNRTETLAQVYQYGGANYTRQALADTLGVSIHRYVRMDPSEFLVVAATIGVVEFALENEIVVRTGTASEMRLPPGMQLLSGEKAAAVLSHSHPGGELARCDVAAQLTAAIVNQRIDIVHTATVDKVFQKIVNLVETDISYTDYDERKEAAVFIAQLEDEPAVPITVSGAYNADQSLYTLSDTFVALLTQTFL